MPFSEFESALIEVKLQEYIDSRRPPEHLRDKVDLAFRLTGESVLIFTIRPLYSDPSVLLENAIAKADYVKVEDKWHVFWMPSDMTWHRYKLVPDVGSIEEFIEVVESDDHACFWG